jgi:hypothetical protein
VTDSKGAVLSACGTYRYRLWRRWDPYKARLAWIMLNPSTADAEHDDPTIRRCIGFAKAWGYGGITVLNVWAFRSTDPDKLPGNDDERRGPENDAHLVDVILGSPGVICAWGAHKGATEAFRRFVQRNPVIDLTALSCLGTTALGHPKHPLYVPSSMPAQPWRLP